jgi:hypothetical protein
VSIFAFGDEGSDSEFEELECRRLFDCFDHPVFLSLSLSCDEILGDRGILSREQSRVTLLVAAMLYTY